VQAVAEPGMPLYGNEIRTAGDERAILPRGWQIPANLQL
jgi:hypothetical protein